MVPLLPTFVVSKSHRTIVDLVPDAELKRYEFVIRSGVSEEDLAAAEKGTVDREDRFGDAYLIHKVDQLDYKTKISTLRGDFIKSDGTIGNRVRAWEKHEFKPNPHDIFQERHYCLQWMRPKKKGKGDEYEFRSVTPEDLERESTVED